MTEDQKDKSVILESLAQTRQVPRTAAWIADELKLAGRSHRDVAGLLRSLAKAGLVEETEDGLGVVRYAITQKGLEALL